LVPLSKKQLESLQRVKLLSGGQHRIRTRCESGVPRRHLDELAAKVKEREDYVGWIRAGLSERGDDDCSPLAISKDGG